MSGSAESRRRARRDDGFTMVEIIVSMGVFAVVLVALLPQLIVGIKATGTARVVSQAKGVGQGQIERLRHLPFHIAPAAGDYIDVLDRYFPDLAPGSSATCSNAGGYVIPTASWKGYVDGAARCDYEPATGPFYRTVTTTPASAGIRAFTVVTDLQFLSGDTPPQPVEPATGYDTGTDARDNPPSSQVGVTVTVFYERDGNARPVTVHSQISERISSPERVRSEADVRVLEIGSVTGAGVPVSLQAGLVHLAGAVSYASTARANLVAVSGELADGDLSSAYPKTGAHLAALAPPTATTTVVNSAAQNLGADCALACWGGTQVPGFVLAADDGRPTVGGSTTPAQVLLDGGTNGGLTFDNGAASTYRTGLQLAPPLVGLDTTATIASGINGCSFAAAGAPSYLAAGGYLRTSDPEVSHDVEACAVGRSRTIELLPTSFAPEGLVQVELRSANARCSVSGAGHIASTTYGYDAVVKYWDGSDHQVAATVAPGQATDQLAAVPLTTSVGGGHTLGDYISSWSSVTLDDVLDETPAGVARLKVPGVVRIVTEPVRPGTEDGVDPSSAISLTVGALECLAEDRR